VLKVLNRTDAFRRPSRFEKFLMACEADARGRTGFEDRPYPQAEYFRAAWKAAGAIDISDLTSSQLSGKEIGKEIASRRRRAIAAVRKDQEPPK
jgi:tRNA nucleotidyltransferase (CCA-adding enzyme)